MENFHITCADRFYTAYRNHRKGYHLPDTLLKCLINDEYMVKAEAFVVAMQDVLQFIVKHLSLTEEQINSISREYARFIIEGDPNDPENPGQKIEDLEDAAKAIQDDYKAGYSQSLERILGQLGLPSAPDDKGAPGGA